MKFFRLAATITAAVLLSLPAAAADFPAWMSADPNGFVQVDFSGERVSQVTQTPVDSLPQPDAYLIRQGLLLPDQTSYTKAMEDFCS